MMPATSHLLFTKSTMGSLPCRSGGNPHTPSLAGCRAPCQRRVMRSLPKVHLSPHYPLRGASPIPPVTAGAQEPPRYTLGSPEGTVPSPSCHGRGTRAPSYNLGSPDGSISCPSCHGRGARAPRSTPPPWGHPTGQSSGPPGTAGTQLPPITLSHWGHSRGQHSGPCPHIRGISARAIH